MSQIASGPNGFHGSPNLNGTTQKRAVRIANCSGASPMDWGYHMYRQATAGTVDAVTGDYLAEMNLAANAIAVAKGEHPGYQQTALDGMIMTLPIVEEKRIKIVINGGALNPKGLAHRVADEAKSKGYKISVAWVEGDNLLPRVIGLLHPEDGLHHLDGSNQKFTPHKTLLSFLNDPKGKPIVSANCYLGARGIVKALENGADIVICGRVADASPVIGVAMWWHGWTFEQYDQIAGALIAGHLIECSGYVTGCNFSGFQQYALDTFVDVGYGIAEVENDGSCVITKHDNLNGLVNIDTVRSQLVYELQGNIYLNNDVQADITPVQLKDEGNNRVRVWGIKGYPPPPTTKFAVFYHGGYQSEIWVGCTGTIEMIEAKADLFERQVRCSMKKLGLEIDVLEFQLYGRPDKYPKNEAAGTTMLRVLSQSKNYDDAIATNKCISEFAFGMQHFSDECSPCSVPTADADGELSMHGTDYGRVVTPTSFNVFYPALIPQAEIDETVYFVDGRSHKAGYPTITMPVEPRQSYETTNPIDLSGQPFGPTVDCPIGDVVQARSGDKASNLNVGFFVHQQDEYEWLKSCLTMPTIVEWLKGDWKPEYFVERVEFPGAMAIHFVVYGILGRGVSSSTILDNLGKGWADYLRSKRVEMPQKFVDRYPVFVEKE